MGTKNITEEIINNFLNSLGYEWNYYIYDHVNECHRRITKYDIKRTTNLGCIIKKIDENKYIKINMEISNKSFKINQLGDFTKLWQEFLNQKENINNL